MEDITRTILSMSENEQFEILQLLEKTFYIPIVFSNEYLETLLDKRRVTKEFMQALNDNSYVNDQVIEAVHDVLQSNLNDADNSEDEYTESEDEEEESETETTDVKDN